MSGTAAREVGDEADERAGDRVGDRASGTAGEEAADETGPDDTATEGARREEAQDYEDQDGVRALEGDGPRRTGGLAEILVRLWGSIRSQRSHERLPQRVLASIAHNDRDSEVLVRLTQFVIFATWGLFYALAPKPESMFASQVPVVIALYLAVTLALMWVGARRKLPDWTIYASIAVDMALLAGLVWSFHRQYAQPPAFYLKDPAMLNFLLLIAVRALRFEARYVVAAGAMAAFSWIGLVAYAIFGAESWPLTRDYVAWVTDGNRVLIGVEMARVISIVMFTAVLALAMRRANAFLVNALAEANAADELSRFFPDAVARKVRDADHEIRPGEGDRRDVAILNVDIRGFTELSSTMAPGWTVSLLSEYQSLVIPVIREHRGLIDKFMGDGIMATFGTTEDHTPTFAADALRALDAVLEKVDAAVAADPDGDLAKLDVNYAVVAGPVVFGTVGDEDRLEYTVIGPSVNLSAKLEKHNKVLGTRALTDRATWEKALEQGYEPKSAAPRSVEAGSAEAGSAGPRIVQTQVTGTDTVLDCVVLA